MPWIPLTKTTTKYDLHPLTVLSWVEKDYICGALIGSNWYIEESTLQEFISEHTPMTLSNRKSLHRLVQDLKKQLKEEIHKGKQTLYILCSLDICSPLFDDIIKDMSELIDDAQMRDIFYSISTGKSKEAIAKKWDISDKSVLSIYKMAVTYIRENWKTTETCKNQMLELTLQCHNYKSALQYQNSEEEVPCMCHKVQKIPVEASKLLLTSLEKLEIDIKIVRTLRKYNIYQLEDLLRFIKRNGFGGLEKLQGVGPLSCTRLLEKLVEVKIMEGKDNCYLFQYLIV